MRAACPLPLSVEHIASQNNVSMALYWNHAASQALPVASAGSSHSTFLLWQTRMLATVQSISCGSELYIVPVKAAQWAFNWAGMAEEVLTCMYVSTYFCTVICPSANDQWTLGAWKGSVGLNTWYPACSNSPFTPCDPNKRVFLLCMHEQEYSSAS